MPTKQKSPNKTYVGTSGAAPSVERIEAAAETARKIGELAAEWADSLLHVYLKAPHLAGAQELVEKVERMDALRRMGRE